MSDKNVLVSYAQNREDLYINWLLGGQKKGFYIDIGANESTIDSVTRFFYLQKDWSGINVEPIRELYDKLVKDRPKDINIQHGISDKRATLTFREYLNRDGLSTFAEDTKNDYGDSLEYKEYNVNTIPLTDIFARSKSKTVDFLKIDVEGYEYEVVKSNDWTKNRPRLVVIEANHVSEKKNWSSILLGSGYSLVFFDGVNNYYTCEDSILKTFLGSYPEYLIGPRIIDAKNMQHQSWLTETISKKYETKISQAKQEVEYLTNDLQGAYAELATLKIRNQKLEERLLQKISNGTKRQAKRVLRKTVAVGKKLLDAPAYQYKDPEDLARVIASDEKGKLVIFGAAKQADTRNYYTATPKRVIKPFIAKHVKKAYRLSKLAILGYK